MSSENAPIPEAGMKQARERSEKIDAWRKTAATLRRELEQEARHADSLTAVCDVGEVPPADAARRTWVRWDEACGVAEGRAPDVLRGIAGRLRSLADELEAKADGGD
jgi:hypothetical protein